MSNQGQKTSQYFKFALFLQSIFALLLFIYDLFSSYQLINNIIEYLSRNQVILFTLLVIEAVFLFYTTYGGWKNKSIKVGRHSVSGKEAEKLGKFLFFVLMLL